MATSRLLLRVHGIRVAAYSRLELVIMIAVATEARGSGSLLEQTSEKWGCKLSTPHRESRFSEEGEK